MKNVIGEKVVCVDDSRNKKFPDYESPIRVGNIYVVSAIVDTPSGIKGWRLIGVAPPPIWTMQCFLPERFRLLSEMKASILDAHFNRAESAPRRA
jgi:hypothetical protein